MVLLAAFMLMESRLGQHANRQALGALEYLNLNSNGVALCAVHGKMALSAAWTPRYVALSAFRQEALGAIDYREQAASEHCLGNSKNFKSRFASAPCFCLQLVSAQHWCR